MSDNPVQSENAPRGGHGQGHGASKTALAVGAIGIVFGDIGTSPLYAFRETFAGAANIAIDRMHVLGVVSLIFWSMLLVVAIQYVTILMRADNKGQGGSLALVALLSRHMGKSSYGWLVVLLGVFATSLFYGDSMITPAISVLSAVEGLTVVDEGLSQFVIPVAVGLLVFLFMLQRRGTAKVGALFAPVMIVWFTVLAGMGGWQIIQNPDILWALNPYYAVMFFVTDGFIAFLALGAVVLAVTGSEALYSDMGHFGRGPMRLSWFGFVMPCLLLNYFGQGAMIAGLPPEQAAEVVRNPFFLLASEEWRLPLVILATVATFIASQAVIFRRVLDHASGDPDGLHAASFDPPHQRDRGRADLHPGHQLGSDDRGHPAGAHIPEFLRTGECIRHCGDRRRYDRHLANGRVVRGRVEVEMVVRRACRCAVPDRRWRILRSKPDQGPRWRLVPADGGLHRLHPAHHLGARPQADARPHERGSAADGDLREERQELRYTCPGTAIFMASSTAGVPSALLHNIKHNKVLHERVVILTVEIADIPYVDPSERCEYHDLGDGFYRAVLHYGFMESTDVPAGLKQMDRCGGEFDMMQTSFFLSRQTLLPSDKPGMPIWREKIFAWLLRNSATAMDFFKLPTNRVVELGSQVEI